MIGRYFILIVTFLFCFTTLIADMFYGEVGIRYLLKDKAVDSNKAVRIFHILALIPVTIAAALPLPVIWNLIDFFVAFLVLFNVYALFRMLKYVRYVLNDYLKQIGSGREEPVWDENTDIKKLVK